MKKLIIGAVLLAAVVGAGVAYSAASPSAKLAKQDRLWGGGYTAPNTCSDNDPSFCPPTAGNFAVDAHAEGDGAEATGNSARNNQTSRTVTCLRVDGNKAVIGGVLVAGTLGNPGDYYLQYVIDRGTSSPSAPRDLVSALYSAPPTGSPAGFPYTCPPPLDDESTYPAFLELTGGDLNVQDAPSS